MFFRLLASSLLVCGVCLTPSAFAADQCNTTAQCQSIYGSRATDCFDSRSSVSVCMCGNARCDFSGGVSSSSSSSRSSVSSSSRSSSSPTTAMLGRFNTSKDLLLAFFDTKPDPDDIHAQAGLGTILKNSAYRNVNYYALTGTYGNNPGSYIDPSVVMEKAFPDHWQSAHGSSNWSRALSKTADLAFGVLGKGGTVWIQEAGQSDFSADLVRELKRRDTNDSRVSFDTKQKVVIVQHSSWNEDHTNSSDLQYVKSNTTYRKIADGNTINSTTGLNTSKYSNWSKAKSDALWSRALGNDKVNSMWTSARTLANTAIQAGNNNPAIKDGGLDFSDTVEALYIFGLETQLDDISDFFDKFLQ